MLTPHSCTGWARRERHCCRHDQNCGHDGTQLWIKTTLVVVLARIILWCYERNSTSTDTASSNHIGVMRPGILCPLDKGPVFTKTRTYESTSISERILRVRSISRVSRFTAPSWDDNSLDHKIICSPYVSSGGGRPRESERK